MGTVFCKIGHPSDLEAKIIVSQQDVSKVVTGAEVKLQLDSVVGGIVKGRIEAVSISNIDNVNPAVAIAYGGESEINLDRASMQESLDSGALRPSNASYEAIVRLPEGFTTNVIGLKGRARIWVGYTPLVFQLQDWIARYIQLH